MSLTSMYIPRASVGTAPREEVKLGGETILVVDDKVEHMSEFRSLLSEAGYKVLTGATADEGLNLYEKHAADISVSIIDLVMPGRDGKDVLNRIVNHDPDASVIVTSGYRDPGVPHEAPAPKRPGRGSACQSAVTGPAGCPWRFRRRSRCRACSRSATAAALSWPAVPT